jgi:hypothetical protein
MKDGTYEGALTLGSIVQTQLIGLMAEADFGILHANSDGTSEFRMTTESGDYVVRIIPLVTERSNHAI